MSSQIEDAFNEAVERRASGYEQRIAALDDLVQRAWRLIAGAMSGNPHKPIANSEWMDAARAWEIDYCMGARYAAATPDPPDPNYCPNCGKYVPRRLNGERSDCGCDRTPPLDGLPPTIYACPTCGGHGASPWGCWGSPEHPHPHAFMRPVHKLVLPAASPDERLREAVAFYADADNYLGGEVGWWGSGSGEPEWCMDFGAIARAALAAADREENTDA